MEDEYFTFRVCLHRGNRKKTIGDVKATSPLHAFQLLDVIRKGWALDTAERLRPLVPQTEDVWYEAHFDPSFGDQIKVRKPR